MRLQPQRRVGTRLHCSAELPSLLCPPHGYACMFPHTPLAGKGGMCPSLLLCPQLNLASPYNQASLLRSNLLICRTGEERVLQLGRGLRGPAGIKPRGTSLLICRTGEASEQHGMRAGGQLSGRACGWVGSCAAWQPGGWHAPKAGAFLHPWGFRCLPPSTSGCRLVGGWQGCQVKLPPAAHW